MILDEIIAHKRQEVARQKEAVPLAELEEIIERMPEPRDFRGALRQPGISLIAEIKRRSPSRGDMLPGVDAVEIGSLYEATGARAISVLTDAKYFNGALSDLTSVHNDVRIPCLRKDFVVDPYQIHEARAAGADAVLLIVRCLKQEELSAWIGLARQLGLAALVETHSGEEISRALDAGAHIVGINNRDLDRQVVDVNITLDLKNQVPGGVTLVSESGIHTREHVVALDDGGVDAILVGEALITSGNIRMKIRELLGRDES